MIIDLEFKYESEPGEGDTIWHESARSLKGAMKKSYDWVIKNKSTNFVEVDIDHVDLGLVEYYRAGIHKGISGRYKLSKGCVIYNFLGGSEGSKEALYIVAPDGSMTKVKTIPSVSTKRTSAIPKRIR